ncbi:MAG: hypothetical protein ACRDIZ_09450 [Actinomycetota bacterium]
MTKANKDLARLKESVQGIFDPGPYEMVADFDAKSGQHTVRAHRTADLPLIEWGTWIGGIAHDLRSALNYIITALVGGKSTRQHEFPIFEDADLYFERDRRGRPTYRSGLSKIDGVGESAAAFIESLQPYHGINKPPHMPPDTITSSALWALHELNRVDKHQDLIVPVPIVQRVNIEHSTDVTIHEYIAPGPLEDNSVLFRMSVKVPRANEGVLVSMSIPRATGGLTITPSPNVYVPVKAHFAFDVAFTENGPTKGGFVVDSLTQILSKIVTTIDAFDRFF